MTQYRSRRTVVEAMQFTTGKNKAFYDWLTARYTTGFDLARGKDFLRLVVGQDIVRAQMYDWVVRLGEGEYEVLSPKAFADKYEPFAETPGSYGRVHSTEEARELELNQGVKDPKKETKE